MLVALTLLFFFISKSDFVIILKSDDSNQVFVKQTIALLLCLNNFFLNLFASFNFFRKLHAFQLFFVS